MKAITISIIISLTMACSLYSEGSAFEVVGKFIQSNSVGDFSSAASAVYPPSLEAFKNAQQQTLSMFSQMPDFEENLKNKTGLNSLQELLNLNPTDFYIAVNRLFQSNTAETSITSIRILGGVEEANMNYVVFEIEGLSNGQSGKIVQMLPVINANGVYFVVPIE